MNGYVTSTLIISFLHLHFNNFLCLKHKQTNLRPATINACNITEFSDVLLTFYKGICSFLESFNVISIRKQCCWELVRQFNYAWKKDDLRFTLILSFTNKLPNIADLALLLSHTSKQF